MSTLILKSYYLADEPVEAELNVNQAHIGENTLEEWEDNMFDTSQVKQEDQKELQ